MAVLKSALALQPQIVEWRRQLHAKPELSYREFETAELAAAALRSFGYEVRTGVARTGVIAEIGSGKTIAIRSDMDALPGCELNRSGYASKTPGVMHACGHDANLACVLAAAQLLAQEPVEGRIRLIIQPGTEKALVDDNASSRMLIDEGAIDGVSAILGMHVDATIASGHVGILSVPLHSIVKDFTVKIASLSAEERDALPLAIAVTRALYQLADNLSRRIPPAFVNIGSLLSSSSRGNITSTAATVSGTITSSSREGSAAAVEELQNLCRRESGETFLIDIALGEADEKVGQSDHVTEVLRFSSLSLLGESQVVPINRKTWALDFSALAQAVPAAFMYLGVQISGDQRIHHHPAFDVNESVLYLGAAVLAETALKLLRD
ncbi:MAG TPA: amidohydrolase [Candidatus Obscuribacterales bacterium]